MTHPGQIFCILTSLLFLGWLHWYNDHRTVRWVDLVDPGYWYRRYYNLDLYQSDKAILWHGSHALHEVALTFDDGPHSESLGSILDILKRYGIHATFFDVGVNMEKNPDLLRRTLREGHEVANHSYMHRRLDTLSVRDRHREINDPDIIFFRLTGRHLALLRPPGMRYNTAALQDTKALGYIVVGYTTASRDFDPGEKPEDIARRTVNRTENGSIILLHDYPPTALALPAILDALKEQGYHFVTISEMIDHMPPSSRKPAESFLQAQADAQ